MRAVLPTREIIKTTFRAGVNSFLFGGKWGNEMTLRTKTWVSFTSKLELLNIFLRSSDGLLKIFRGILLY